MAPTKYYQLIRGAADKEQAGVWFFRHWGYRPAEVLSSGPVHYAGPLKAKDAERIQGPLTDRNPCPECSTANCA